MAKAVKTEEASGTPALQVLPRSTNLNALAGTIDEKIRAFDQIAANLARLQLNGWDEAQKVKAGCWLADGAGMHPATFMHNHHCMLIKGKLVVEPKWEFVLGVLQSRVPGFKFEVLVETDDCAKVRMSDKSGAPPFEVEYSVEDARRQGLMGRDNAWSSGSTREMCFKQAVKRCGRRIGAAAMMDLPVGLDSYVIVQPEVLPDAGKAAERAISEAVVLDDEPAGAAGEFGGAAPSAATATPPDEDQGPLAALAAELANLYGKQSKAVLLEKASLIYNEMMKATTGSDPHMIFKRADQIGPAEARQMVEWLSKRRPLKGESVSEARAPAVTEPAVVGGRPALEATPAPEPDTDAPPPAEGLDVARAYEDLMLTIKRAKRIFAPRAFVVEYPEGSGKYWFNDATTFGQIGSEKPLKLMDQGEITAPAEVVAQLSRILKADCDKAERGGR